jgi:hypothetical protein
MKSPARCSGAVASAIARRLPASYHPAAVSFNILRSNVDAATDGLSEIFASTFRKTFGDFQLNEVEVSLEISADGSVAIMGSGVGIEGRGSMKLKFLRQKSSSTQRQCQYCLTTLKS